MNKSKSQKEGIIILGLILSGIYFFMALGNHPDDSIIGILFISLLAGFVCSFILWGLVQVLKNWFKW